MEPDEAREAFYLSTLDSFTGLHLRLLRYAAGEGHDVSHGGGILREQVMRECKELRGQQDLVDQVWKDLYFRGLVAIERLDARLTFFGLQDRKSTKLGASLFQFITR